MLKLTRHAFLLSATFLLGGCSVVTELGMPCELVRRATEEELAAGMNRAVPVKEGELTPGQDFISFGSLGCEEQICVRDAANPPDHENPDKIALGYCSIPCIEGNSCEVTHPDAPKELSDRMTCRRMMLDDEALNRLKVSNPEMYRRTFGNYENASFCAGRIDIDPAGTEPRN